MTQEPPAEYQRAYVAFLDIIGFEDAVMRSVTDHVLAQRLHQTMCASADAAAVMPRFTAFSDSLILSGSVFVDILHSVHSIWRLYAKEGFFLRGGIAHGLVFHEENVAYGPGVIEAYRLEARVARVPRVLIAPSISIAAADHLETFAEVLPSVIGIDSDGFSYLKTFNWFSTEQSPLPNLEDLEPIRDHIRAGLTEGENDPALLSKFLWLALRFNERLKLGGRTLGILTEVEEG